jgi:uncharacterized protein (TIGR02246 family)
MNSTIARFTTAIVLLQLAAICRAQTWADTSAVYTILKQEADAWNRGDAEAYSQYFAEDGTFTNVLGLFYTGHQNFLLRHDQIFKGVFAGTHFKQHVVSLKYVNPYVAIVETLTSVSDFSEVGPPKGTTLDENGCLLTRLLQVMVKYGNDWKIAAYHNVDIKVAIPETVNP